MQKAIVFQNAAFSKLSCTQCSTYDIIFLLKLVARSDHQLLVLCVSLRWQKCSEDTTHLQSLFQDLLGQRPCRYIWSELMQKHKTRHLASINADGSYGTTQATIYPISEKAKPWKHVNYNINSCIFNAEDEPLFEKVPLRSLRFALVSTAASSYMITNFLYQHCQHDPIFASIISGMRHRCMYQAIVQHVYRMLCNVAIRSPCLHQYSHSAACFSSCAGSVSAE